VVIVSFDDILDKRLLDDMGLHVFIIMGADLQKIKTIIQYINYAVNIKISGYKRVFL
jgi:hypothetical protein